MCLLDGKERAIVSHSWLDLQPGLGTRPRKEHDAEALVLRPRFSLFAPLSMPLCSESWALGAAFYLPWNMTRKFHSYTS